MPDIIPPEEPTTLERREVGTVLGIIGGVAAFWASIEVKIDCWVDMIHATGGDVHFGPRPAFLDRELDYIKRAWPHYPTLPRNLVEEGWRLYDEVHNLKDFRHNLVHGIADLNDLSRLNITNWKVKRGNREELQMPYSWDAIRKNLARITRLNSDLKHFVLRLDAVFREDPEESDR